MPLVLALVTLTLLALVSNASAQNAGPTLDAVGKALGASAVTSIQYTGSGGVYAVGQSAVPGLPWPQFNVKSHTRSVTVITHEVNKPFFEQALAAPATIRPDLQAKAARKPMVEGVRDRRTLTDGTRIVEVYHIAANLHHDGLLMVYLPQEKLLSEADAYTPLPPNTAPPMPPSPFTVNLSDNITRLGLVVGDVAPLHGRIVPLAELQRTLVKNP